MFEFIRTLYDALLHGTLDVLSLICVATVTVYFLTKKREVKMATGGEPADVNQGDGSIPDDVSAPTQCPICQDEYENPRHLEPCLHIFCEKCIMGVVNAVGEDYFDCPICREPTYLPREGVKGLKQSYIMNSVMDWFKTYRSKHGCSKTSNNCKHHPDEQLRFQCHNCNDLICPECLDGSHNGHLVKSLKKIIDDEKKEMKAKLQEKETNLGARKRKLEEQKTEYEKQSKTELEKLQRTKKQAEEMIEKGKEIARAAKDMERKFKDEQNKTMDNLTKKITENTQQMETVRNVQRRLQDMEVSNETGDLTEMRQTLDNVADSEDIEIPQTTVQVPDLGALTHALNIPTTFRMESVEGKHASPTEESGAPMNEGEDSDNDDAEMEVEQNANIVVKIGAAFLRKFETSMNVKEVSITADEKIVVVNNKKCFFYNMNGVEKAAIEQSLSSVDVKGNSIIAYSQKDKRVFEFSLEENRFKDKKVPNIEKKNLSAITRGHDSVIFLASSATNKIYKFTEDTREPQIFLDDPHNETLHFPAYICTNPDGDLIVSNTHGHNVKMFDHNNRQLLWTCTGGETLKEPKGVACDANGNIFVADYAKSRVVIIDRNGNFRGNVIDHIPFPTDVTVRQNKLVVAHLNEGGKAFENHEISIYNLTEQ